MRQSFKEYLAKRNIELDRVSDGEEIIYQGLFQVSEDKVVNFGILFITSEEPWINYQVVFSDLALCNYDDRHIVTYKLNKLNIQGLGYYNLFLEEDGSVVLRTISCAKDYDTVYNVFLAGARTLQKIYKELIDILNKVESND